METRLPPKIFLIRKMDNNFAEKRKIAMFSIHSDPLAVLGAQESGGQNVYVNSLVRELDKKDWSVDVFTRWDDARKKKITNSGRNSRLIRLKGGPVKYIPRMELYDFFPEIYQSFLNFIGNQNPYLLFHGHYWDGGWMALKASQQFLKPLIENFHSLGKVRLQTQQRYLGNINEKSAFDQRFAIEEEIIKAASLIISLSEAEKKDLNALYGAPLEKITVIPGGINLAQFQCLPKENCREKLNFRKNDFVLLFVGRLEWRKGLGTLISAVNLLKNDIPNIKGIIVGGRIFGRQKNKDDFKEYQRLLRKAKEENVEELIRFVGRVDHGRLPLYYSAADIFVIPSYYEPFGLVTLEAMACRVPVIASKMGGLQISVKDGETGLLFEPRNAKDLKEKVLRLYNSKELAEKLVKNAYDNIKNNYSWKDIAEKIRNIYKSLLNL